MNTIPSTLEDRKPTYTVLGGGRGGNCPDSFPVSVLLLNRGPRLYRAALLQELSDIGFDSIVSVEGDGESPELEGLAARFPSVRFLSFKERVNLGDMMNTGMRESCAPYVFVLWNDMRLATSALSGRFFDRVAELDRACLVPTLCDPSGSVLPSVMHPALARSALRVVALPPRADGDKSLFPFDLCGIYSREKFILLGGFDWTIGNPHWQRMDFGFRAWLWGEEIRYAQALRLNYGSAPAPEDTTPDHDYGRFWLKNLAPVHRGDSAYIPTSRLFRWALSSRRGPLASLEEFRAARNWVAVNSFRFRQDAARVADLWDPLS